MSRTDRTEVPDETDSKENVRERECETGQRVVASVVPRVEID